MKVRTNGTIQADLQPTIFFDELTVPASFASRHVAGLSFAWTVGPPEDLFYAKQMRTPF